MNVRTKNLLTASLAALLFVAFVALGTGLGRDDKPNKRLAAVDNTTTTALVEQTTTTTSPIDTTTTTLPVTATTSDSSVTTTTAKRSTTATTRSTTATTRRPSATTTTVASPTGTANELNDNSATFSIPSGSKNTTAVPANPGPFTVKVEVVSVSPTSSDSAQVVFRVTLVNNTGKTVTFPGNMHIQLHLQRGSDAPTDYTLADESHPVASIAPGEKISATTGSTTVLGAGDFNVTAGVTVDYGS